MAWQVDMYVYFTGQDRYFLLASYLSSASFSAKLSITGNAMLMFPKSKYLLITLIAFENLKAIYLKK